MLGSVLTLSDELINNMIKTRILMIFLIYIYSLESIELYTVT